MSDVRGIEKIGRYAEIASDEVTSEYPAYKSRRLPSPDGTPAPAARPRSAQAESRLLSVDCEPESVSAMSFRPRAVEDFTKIPVLGRPSKS